MEKDNIEENNALLCDFLGLKTRAKGSRVEIDGPLFFAIVRARGMSDAVYNLRLSQFHKDWNWLMVVIKKIYELDIYYDKYIQEHTSMLGGGKIKITTDINDMYKQCVYFVQWYNKNKDG